MTVRAELEGHPNDLEALARQYPSGDPRVVAQDGVTYLETTELDRHFGGAAGVMVEAASKALARLNGFLKIADPHYSLARLRNRFERAGNSESFQAIGDDAHARDRITVVQPRSVDSRGRVGTPTISAGGAPPATPPAPEGLRHVAKASVDRNVADLLELIGSEDQLDWYGMWKASEIVRYAVGGKPKLLATGWTSEDEYDSFAYPANNEAASGPGARHARRPPSTPPAWIMTEAEGREYVRRLAGRWLNSL